MKPSRSYHALSSEHREPGGLRRLDYVVARIAEWRKDRLPSLLRVLVVTSGDGGIALPVASLGYTVTLCESDERVRNHILESAKDVGVPLRTVSNLEEIRKEQFDVIVAGDAISQKFEDVFLQIAALASPQSLFLLVPRSRPLSWRKFEDALHRNGFKISESSSLSLLRGFIALLTRLGMKRGGSAFHALDAVDGTVSSHVSPSHASGWLVEIHPYDASKPLVLHLVPTFSAGGAEALVAELVRRLPSRGYSAEAVALMGGGPLETVFAAEQLPHRVFDRTGLFGMGAFFPLRRLLQRERPAIVHTHLFGADLWGRLAALTTGVRYIVTTEHNVHPEHGWLKKKINRTLARFTAACIAVSTSVKSYMESEEKIPAERIRVIRNGIDLERIVPRTAHPFRDVPRLIIVGRLVPQKGHATLLKALALVKQPWTLQVVGTGPLEKDLRALADRLSIGPRVHWLGYRSDVAELLAESDLFCFPSLWEGLGLAFVEAAAAGIPIIASDLPVFHDVLDASSCTYVPPSDVPQLAHALAALLHDPSSAIAAAQRAVPKVHSAFSIDRMVDAYAKLYGELLKKMSYADSPRQ